MSGQDFYVPDEAVEDVAAIFERGEKGRTAPPTFGRTEHWSPGVPIQGPLAEVATERARQNAKWGEENHPDGTGGKTLGRVAELAHLACQEAASQGTLTWRHILREGVAEAFAEPDPAKLCAELVQVAAVAVAWIEAIDRRTAEETRHLEQRLAEVKTRPAPVATEEQA